MKTKQFAVSFETSFGHRISGVRMLQACELLAQDTDWQTVGYDVLRDEIPEHDQELDELNEVLRECERRNEESAA